MRPETQTGAGADGIWRIAIPPSAGAGNLFCKISGLGKRFGAIYFQLLKQDGQLFLLICVASLCGAIPTALEFYFRAPVLLVIFALLMFPAFRAWRYYFNDVWQVGADRPFQLYLRAFASDKSPKWRPQYRDVSLTGAMGRNVRAIGSPRDSFPLNLGINVSLVAAPEDKWQEVVLDMMRRADYIWIQCGLHAWVQWGLRRVLALRSVRQVGFILPAEGKEEVWRSCSLLRRTRKSLNR